MRFILCTSNFVGLGLANKLVDEGEDVLLAVSPEQYGDEPEFDKPGTGLVQRVNLDKVEWKDDDVILFDYNHNADLADELRAKGHHVFGTSVLSSAMEHDRGFACQVAAAVGLDMPKTVECHSAEEGITHLDANDDVAYAMKVNASEVHHLTFVPEHEDAAIANRALASYLAHAEAAVTSDYILQEMKRGVEVNVELWLDRGMPFMAWANLESKRGGARDSDEMVGCAGDCVFALPLDCPLVKMTAGKMLTYFQEQRHTGFCDANVIIADDCRPYWLEACDRFGYNQHPSTFLGLALDGFGNLMFDWVSGNTQRWERRFRMGAFAASLSLYVRHPRPGLPCYVQPRAHDRFYLYDGILDDDSLLLTGFSEEAGCLVEHAYTVADATRGVLDQVQHGDVWFPDMAYRADLDKSDYRGSPVQRYQALQAMGLLTAGAGDD